VTHEYSCFLAKCDEKQQTKMIKTFGLNTCSKVRKPGTQNDSTTKSREWRDKDIVSMTMWDNLVVERAKVMSGSLGRERRKVFQEVSLVLGIPRSIERGHKKITINVDIWNCSGKVKEFCIMVRAIHLPWRD